MAAATTASVNNSREPVPATCQRNHGITLRPTTIIRTMKAATSSKVQPMVDSSEAPDADDAAVPPSTAASGGRSTRTSTVARSSTTSQPTAMRPFMVSSTPRASSAFRSTTVLAHDSDTPNSKPWPHGQPHHHASPMPSRVAQLIWTTAPGMAMRLTESRSLSEKCRPTPNISNITPISDNWAAICMSATNPGVAGPMTIPASR